MKRHGVEPINDDSPIILNLGQRGMWGTAEGMLVPYVYIRINDQGPELLCTVSDLPLRGDRVDLTHYIPIRIQGPL